MQLYEAYKVKTLRSIWQWIASKFLALAALVAISFLFGCATGGYQSDCSVCSLLKPCIPPLCDCGDGRRPEVICWKAPYVYEFDCEECRCDHDKQGESSSSSANEIPITPDLLSPFLPQSSEYRIAPGDILEISVFGDEDTLVEEVVVAPDGRVYYTFLDGIPAEGLTSDELRLELQAKLTNLFVNPLVSIIPRQIVGQKYVVLGRVRKPGAYPLYGSLTLRQAIGSAGGLLLEPDVIPNFGGIGGGYFLQGGRYQGLYVQGYNATKQAISSLKDSFVIREGKRINVDFIKLVESGDASQDIFIHPGDYIYIAAKETPSIYIIGGSIGGRRIRYRDGLTLVNAFATTGTWVHPSPYSPDLHRFLILRGSLSEPCAIDVDVSMILKGEGRDVYLCPGDIIYVYNKNFRFGRELIRIAVTSFIQSFAVGAGSVFVNEH